MKKKLQELSDEALLKEAKSARFVLGLYLGIIGVMIVTGIISTLKQGINLYTFLPVPFLGIAIVFWSNYEKIIKELKSRNLK
jgi:hypothetical protein